MNATLLSILMVLVAVGQSVRADEPAGNAAAPNGDEKRTSDTQIPPQQPGSPAEQTSGEANKAEAPPDLVRRWIEQLDSDEYWTREEASKRLFAAGGAAIAPLAEAVRSTKLEVSTRAVGVLSRLMELDDPQLELAAEAALEAIAASRVTSAAARAETALENYRGSRQERVLNRLRQLGAAITTQSLSTGEIFNVDISIGEGWRGSTHDLAALKRVPSLQSLHIYVDSVDDEAVKHLEPLKQLTTLDLFGTRISDDGFKRLEKSLAGTQIGRRKGGMLGVRGDPTSQGGGCLVTTVVPGSAAEKAGLQAGDVITKFEGEAVEDFNGLTKLISTKGGGEAVAIEFQRQVQVGEKVEKQTLVKKATLDQWKSMPQLNVDLNGGDLQIIIGR
jgi:hypothetical protein